MKPPPFQYHDPTTISEAVDLLSKLEDSKLLAGGQSLVPMLNMRFVFPGHLIDLNGVAGLAGISEADGELVIGAMTRQRDIERSNAIRRHLPIMTEALQHVGHLQTRNRGTMGGSLGHLDPAAELVCLASLYDATVTITGAAGERTLAFSEFPLAYMMPALAPDEMIERIAFPVWPVGHGYGFVEFARRHGDFAIVSAAALLDIDGGGMIRRAALALGGVGPLPLRMAEAETALVGEKGGEGAFAQAAALCAQAEAMSDALFPASYRQHLACVMARRALELAAERAGTDETRQGRRS